jgi:hypothetical protein
MRRRLAWAAGIAAWLAGGDAFPCGAPFGDNITVDPHQDIIIGWKDGVETYVFQPIFCGTAQSFGLILPVPSLLAQKPSLSSQQAFNTATAVSEPTKRQVVQKSGGCASGGTDLAGGSKNGSDDEGTAVVASGQVGFLDWVQLKADTPSSFTEWLTSNGYPYSATSASVFSYYVGKGWYFLAFRISQEAAPGGGTVCKALGPVAFSFPTSVPVVPSRMASAGNSSGSQMWWRIFGITRGDTQLSFPNVTSQYGGLWYSGSINAADVPSFGGLAEPGDRLTRLILNFYSGSATSDADLTLDAAADYRGTQDVVVYDDSACSVGAKARLPHSCLVSLFGLAMAGLFCWRRWR